MKILIILFTVICLSGYSQVAVGKTLLTNSSVSLEFGDESRGLLLPWVTSAASVTGVVNGTIIYDTSDKKVKYRKNGSWFDLSVDNTGLVDTSLQNSLTENPTAKVIIGTNNVSTNITPGILVLADNNKAMILPKVDLPQYSIINPSPGMMVYDKTNHMLAVYNGTVWSFWKP